MEYLEAVVTRYRRAAKALKTRILDELCSVCGLNRKYVIWKLNRWRESRKPKRQHPRCRARRYEGEVLRVMEKVWEAAGYPWSVRLKAILRLWRRWVRQRYRLSAGQEEKLLQMSPSTIDRYLRGRKQKIKRRLYGRTKPGNLLRHQIPVRCEHWDAKQPGYLELDLVSHSGECASGEFLYTLNLTDIASGWVESRAVMGKGEQGVQEALQAISEVLPFKVLGIDSDNGSEFINWHLKSYCDRKDVQFTRSRPYKKDDNAHIEQKNWTHVRKLIGWDRYDSLPALYSMNALYGHELRLWMNLFLPSVKLQTTVRKGSRRSRRYDQPQTPLDRLLSFPLANQKRLLELKSLRERLDPFELSQKVNQRLEQIWSYAHHQEKPSEVARKTAEELRELPASERKTVESLSQIFGVRFYVRTRPGGKLVRVDHG
jgi:hypothetical protein